MHCATMASPAVFPEKQTAPSADELIALFDDLFMASYRTRLCGGASEPFYEPAVNTGDYNRIYFREDFAASALHEIAHWCIAGEARRQQRDYGYWYHPDGRDSELQREFQRVEAGPQALEWLFSLAAGLPFRISLDNLATQWLDPFPFQLAVWQRACQLYRRGLGARASLLRDALLIRFDGDDRLPALAELRSF